MVPVLLCFLYEGCLCVDYQYSRNSSDVTADQNGIVVNEPKVIRSTIDDDNTDEIINQNRTEHNAEFSTTDIDDSTYYFDETIGTKTADVTTSNQLPLTTNHTIEKKSPLLTKTMFAKSENFGNSISKGTDKYVNNEPTENEKFETRVMILNNAEFEKIIEQTKNENDRVHSDYKAINLSQVFQANNNKNTVSENFYNAESDEISRIFRNKIVSFIPELYGTKLKSFKPIVVGESLYNQDVMNPSRSTRYHYNESLNLIESASTNLVQINVPENDESVNPTISSLISPADKYINSIDNQQKSDNLQILSNSVDDLRIAETEKTINANKAVYDVTDVEQQVLHAQPVYTTTVEIQQSLPLEISSIREYSNNDDRVMSGNTEHLVPANKGNPSNEYSSFNSPPLNDIKTRIDMIPPLSNRPPLFYTNRLNTFEITRARKPFSRNFLFNQQQRRHQVDSSSFPFSFPSSYILQQINHQQQYNDKLQQAQIQPPQEDYRIYSNNISEIAFTGGNSLVTNKQPSLAIVLYHNLNTSNTPFDLSQPVRAKEYSQISAEYVATNEPPHSHLIQYPIQMDLTKLLPSSLPVSVPPAQLIPLVQRVTANPLVYGALNPQPSSRFLPIEQLVDKSNSQHRALKFMGYKSDSKHTELFKPSHPVWDSIYPPRHMYYVPMVVSDDRKLHSRSVKDVASRRNQHLRTLIIEYGGFKPLMIPSTSISAVGSSK